MSHYRYRVYYKYLGPSLSDPFASEKSPEEVHRALLEFPSELAHRLSDLEANISATEPTLGTAEVMLSAETTESEEQFKCALVATLREWKLLAELSRPSDGVA